MQYLHHVHNIDDAFFDDDFLKNDSRGIMLETSEERIKLLKTGLNCRTIEDIYIKNNNFKIVHVPILMDMIGYDILINNKARIISEVEAKHHYPGIGNICLCRMQQTCS